MLDRPVRGDIAILVSLDFGEVGYEDSLQELIQLAESANIEISSVIEGKRSRPDAALYAGTGKVEEIALAVAEAEIPLVIFNHNLSGAQERNLERELKCRVVDRTGLILDIFAQRAHSHEGQLQVELAQLQHLSTRLVRGWTHLERQKGGVGLRGPGETQLETDRRLLGKRVKQLKDKLLLVKQQRDVQRRSRLKSNVLSVSLVGYTNAGKSTLFNALTHANTYAANKLFATLDTMTRKLFIAECGQIVMSDTVGFIRQLPHSLVASFRATLEETAQADLLLHVIDANHPNKEQQIEEVNKVLDEIGAKDTPQVLILNKCDLQGIDAGVDRDEYGKICRIRLSAMTGDGVPLVRELLKEFMAYEKPEKPDMPYRPELH